MLSLDESHHDDIHQVFAHENEILVSPFSKEEVTEAIFRMKHNMISCQDGFPPEFYQVFWNIVKDDLMAIFMEFREGSSPLHSLNFGTSKKIDAKKIKQHRPSIC